MEMLLCFRHKGFMYQQSRGSLFLRLTSDIIESSSQTNEFQGPAQIRGYCWYPAYISALKIFPVLLPWLRLLLKSVVFSTRSSAGENLHDKLKSCTGYVNGIYVIAPHLSFLMRGNTYTLNLRQATINKQLNTVDVARIIRGEERDGAGNLRRLANTA